MLPMSSRALTSESAGRYGWSPTTIDQLRLQGLLSDLAERLAAAEPDAIDDLLADSLREVAEALQLDRIAAWSWIADGSAGAPVHSWITPAASEASDSLQLASIPFIAAMLQAGEVSWFTRIEEVPDAADRETLLRHGLRSAVVVPVACPDAAAGTRRIIAFGSPASRPWTPGVVAHLRLLSGIVGQALARQASMRALQLACDELRQLRQHMTAPKGRDAERACVRSDATEVLARGVIVGQSQAIRDVLDQVRQVGGTDSTVLLLGETGTGKELIAAHLHDLSARSKHLMVRVNCAAIPATLIESELFGRERGAFTGALARQIGRFELADRSTIFLDEIGDLPPEVQVKLLRVVEERQIERLGNPKAIPVNVRIVAATHRNLEQRIIDNAFREDLFYRLNVFPIQIPALRERVEDIPLLVWRFVLEFARTFGKRIESIPRQNMEALQQYAWPGNIRELRNVVERAMIVTTGPQLDIPVPGSSGADTRHSVIMADVEREHMRSVLETSKWRVRGPGGAAERLGLRPTTLETRMLKLGLTRPSASLTSTAH